MQLLLVTRWLREHLQVLVLKLLTAPGRQLNHRSDHIYGLKGMGPIPMLKCEAQSDTGRQ